VKGKDPTTIFVKALVSLHLSARAPATMCVGLDRVLSENMKHNKDTFEGIFLYLCNTMYI